MDRIDHQPRRAHGPDESHKPLKASPWIFLLVVGGVGIFLALLSPLQKPRTPAPRPLQNISAAPGNGNERKHAGELQPSWKRPAPAVAAAPLRVSSADAGAP